MASPRPLIHPPAAARRQGPRIVIVGAGFAGIRAARRLAKTNAEVVLVDRHNYHTFIPLLYQVAMGFIPPETIAYPVRNWIRRLPNARFLQAQVQQLDLEAQRIVADGLSLDYDYLLLATGSQTRFLQVPGAPKHTFPLRTLADAIALRHQIFHSLEAAVRTGDLRYLSFVIVGGGPTGVELAGALRELLAACRRDYPELDLTQAQIRIVQSGERLLAGLPAPLGRYTQQQLQQRGIEVRLHAKVKAVTPDTVTLSDDTSLPAATVIWTAGVLAEKPQLSRPEHWEVAGIASQQRVAVTPTLQLASYPSVYAVGDVAYVEQNGEALFGVAPEALQQGDAAADNICRQLRGRAPQPFNYFDKGRAAIIARHAGVAYLFSRIQLTGPLAWLLWLGIHLYYLPGTANRLGLLTSWLRDYLLRDRAYRQNFAPPSAAANSAASTAPNLSHR